MLARVVGGDEEVSINMFLLPKMNIFMHFNEEFLHNNIFSLCLILVLIWPEVVWHRVKG